MSYARLTHTEHEEQKLATPLKRELIWCLPWWGWQLTRLLHWEVSSTGFIHWGNQGPPAEASEAACNDLFWLCTCVYKHPMNRQLCLFSWHCCTRNSNTKLSRKRHPTPSKDMINGLNQTYHSERAEVAPWRVDQRSSLPPTNNLCHPLPPRPVKYVRDFGVNFLPLK